MKLVTIVGARPQFVKAAAVSRVLAERNGDGGSRSRCSEVLVHTGQHYDYEMSAVFFGELELPDPAHHLGIGSGPHGAQTGRMLEQIERVLMDERPDCVLVYGDTNSTAAGSLAAAKLHIPVAHVEAGLRSYDRRMPEEVNRILTDHVSDWLFCPSEAAVRNLSREGLTEGVHQVGDVMYDVLRHRLPAARERFGSLAARLGLAGGKYALATVHRAANTDDPDRLRAIMTALDGVAAEGLPVVLPLHPRTRKILGELGVELRSARVIAPLSYADLLSLLANSAVALTDSGGVQKEAYWLGIPCATLREETEWTETVDSGWNRLVGADPARIREAALMHRPVGEPPPLYGDGRAAERVAAVLEESIEGRSRQQHLQLG